jgi:hypothetical protein
VIVRDLERLLKSSGAASRKIEAVTQILRKAKQLPVAGRGLYAAHVGAAEAAAVMIALAGSSKASEADARLLELQSLRLSGSTPGGQTFMSVLTQLLQNPEQFGRVHSVRIGRTTRHATVQYETLPPMHFGPPGFQFEDDRFYVEGVISGGLVRLIASALRGVHQVGEQSDLDEDDAKPPSAGS